MLALLSARSFWDRLPGAQWPRLEVSKGRRESVASSAHGKTCIYADVHEHAHLCIHRASGLQLQAAVAPSPALVVRELQRVYEAQECLQSRWPM